MKTISDKTGWLLVGISFAGGVYICWLFGHALVLPVTHFIIAHSYSLPSTFNL